MHRILPFMMGLLLLWGCRSHPARANLLDSSSVTTEVRHLTSAIPSEDACPVTLRLISLERMPRSTLPTLAEEARFVMARSGDGSIVSSLFMGRAARIGSVDDTGAATADLRREDAGASRLIEEVPGLLPPGSTATFVITGKWNDPSRPWPGIRSEMRLLIHRGAEGISPGLVLMGPGPRMEIVILESRPLEGWARFVLLLRSPFGDDRGEALAAVVEIGAPRAEWHAEPMEGAPPRVLPLPESRPLDTPDIAKGLEGPEGRRNLLIHIGGVTGARITRDVALSASESILKPVCRALVSRLGQTPGDLGWILESTTLEVLLQLRAAKGAMWDIEGILVRHMGEAGRRSALVEEILGTCKGLPELEAALVGANREFLENAPPAARVRAHDYLVSRGAAPEGYDPLATLEDRRAALAAGEEEDR